MAVCKRPAAGLFLTFLTVACSERPAPPPPPARSPVEVGPARRPGPRDANTRLDHLVRDNLDAELAASPVAATWLGVHAYDDRLDDVRLEAQGREAGRLKALLERLRGIDAAQLDPNRRIDRLLLEHRAEHALYELLELRPLERNPIVYVDLLQGAILELVTDETTPVTERLRAITSRLWRFRSLMDEARRNLRPQVTSELLVRRAIDLAQAQKLFLSETLPRVLAVQDAKLMDDFRAADGDALRALDDFIGWLQKDLQPRARGDFALGRERFMEKLRLVEHVQVTPELLISIGERELKEARKRYEEAARQVLGGKPGDAMKLVEDDHPKAGDLQALARLQAEAVMQFFQAQRLGQPPEPVRPKVVDMPPALWGLQQLDMAGPLERPRDAYLYVDPVVNAWPERRKQEHLRALNRPAMLLSVLHQVPGHYVAGWRVRRAPTTMQKIALAPSFVEGWPHYVERMLVQEGIASGDPKLRMLLERSIMVRAARLVAAVKLHALGGKLDDAARVFAEADLDDYQARREAERAAADPMVLADALGRIEIERLRDDWRAAHEDASLGAFHDALLSHGSAPIAALRRLLLPSDARAPL